jgi:hypothetical protein
MGGNQPRPRRAHGGDEAHCWLENIEKDQECAAVEQMGSAQKLRRSMWNLGGFEWTTTLLVDKYLETPGPRSGLECAAL